VFVLQMNAVVYKIGLHAQGKMRKDRERNLGAPEQTLEPPQALAAPLLSP